MSEAPDWMCQTCKEPVGQPFYPPMRCNCDEPPHEVQKAEAELTRLREENERLSADLKAIQVVAERNLCGGKIRPILAEEGMRHIARVASRRDADDLS